MAPSTGGVREGEPFDFVKWFLKNKFSLMDSMLPELRRDPSERDVARLEARFRAATRHARRVLAVRLVIIVLLALGAGSSLASFVVAALSDIPGVQETYNFLAYLGGTLFAVSGLIFLGINRYLDLLTVSANFVAMQIATTPQKGARGAGPEAAGEK